MSESTHCARPLVSFVVLGYNQERFVEEAVRAAFAQTYSPLEIVLSDDCSSDQTFAIMERLAGAYSGPHQITLSRSERNAGGIGLHLNRVFDLARGVLIIVSAADDVSVPDRTQRNYDAWEATGRRAHCLYSGYTVVDGTGNPLMNTGMEGGYDADGRIVEEEIPPGAFFTAAKPRLFGCAMAYTPTVLGGFGPLSADCVHEDDTLGLRAAMLGVLVRIQEPLVKYRLHGDNVFGSVRRTESSRDVIRLDEARSVREIRSRRAMYESFHQDLAMAAANALLPAGEADRLIALCCSRIALLEARRTFHEAGFLRKGLYWVRLWRLGLEWPDLWRLLPRFLPVEAYCAIKALAATLRRVLPAWVSTPS